jgi:O-antigen/teichoic acid export membrane protein
MNNISNNAKNFIGLSVTQVINKGISPWLVILITRFLGSEGYGKLGFA